METGDVAILAFAAVLITALVGFAQWAKRSTELDAEERRAAASEAARRDAVPVAPAPVGHGPPDGTALGVHLGSSVVRGKRVARDDPGAAGYVVLEGAELLEGRNASPLGGRQWLPEGLHMQELQ